MGADACKPGGRTSSAASHRLRLIYHPDAEGELVRAAQFYERRVPTLGAQFLDATDRAIHVLEDDPERWSIIEADVRHHLIPRLS